MSNEREFTRFIDIKLVEKLKNEPLYKEHLEKDIKSGSIFPAFRNSRIDFYYKGSKLFSYNGTFTTHHKFASIIIHEHSKKYISDGDLKNARTINNFMEGFETIKSNAELYSGIESSFVSKIYHNSNYVSCKDNIVVLDIEASFDNTDIDENDSKNKQDRIDLVLLEKKSNSIYFIEAKHFSNSEIWSSVGTPPKVVDQLQRYNNQIGTKNVQIINAYNNYLRFADEMFGTELSRSPINKISPKTTLLIFGFDSWQKNKFNQYLISDGSLEGHTYRFVGEPTSAMQIMKAVREGTATNE
jgi:hypothetical protein